MGAKVDNPQTGDLVKWLNNRVPTPPTTPDSLWIVLDFFPWGCDGKHAWSIQNPIDGMRRIVFRGDIEKVKP